MTTKLEGRIRKLNERHLTLAARIVIANSLLLGCIWFMLTVWAGKNVFLKKLQSIVDKFVWKGRSRIRGTTTALPKANGGLNLLRVEEQYKAFSGNFMMWLMMSDMHPLRSILQNHIQSASWRRWGIRDLTWIVSKCGTLHMAGSAPWRAICCGWNSLKGWLRPNIPANTSEWQNLRLWRPQINHINPTRAGCRTVSG